MTNIMTTQSLSIFKAMFLAKIGIRSCIGKFSGLALHDRLSELRPRMEVAERYAANRYQYGYAG